MSKYTSAEILEQSTETPHMQTESQVAEKSSWDQANKGETWFGLEK
jgi:hypothetical protein